VLHVLQPGAWMRANQLGVRVHRATNDAPRSGLMAAVAAMPGVLSRPSPAGHGQCEFTRREVDPVIAAAPAPIAAAAVPPAAAAAAISTDAYVAAIGPAVLASLPVDGSWVNVAQLGKALAIKILREFGVVRGRLTAVVNALAAIGLVDVQTTGHPDVRLSKGHANAPSASAREHLPWLAAATAVAAMRIAADQLGLPYAIAGMEMRAELRARSAFVGWALPPQGRSLPVRALFEHPALGPFCLETDANDVLLGR